MNECRQYSNTRYNKYSEHWLWKNMSTRQLKRRINVLKQTDGSWFVSLQILLCTYIIILPQYNMYQDQKFLLYVHRPRVTLTTAVCTIWALTKLMIKLLIFRFNLLAIYIRATQRISSPKPKKQKNSARKNFYIFCKWNFIALILKKFLCSQKWIPALSGLKSNFFLKNLL